MKIVINACYGGFGLSHEAIMRYAEIKGINLVWKEHRSLNYYYKDCVSDENYFYYYYKDCVSDENYFSYSDIPRNDPALVQVVEEMGSAANDEYAKLKIVEIPDDVRWHIAEYDGSEHIAENHRTWS
jgi:hypothetical protein